MLNLNLVTSFPVLLNPEVVVEEKITPKATVQVEYGKASWYGPGFHGRKTASGEIFNQNELTAAHPSLPFNTIVKVTDTDTGNSVTVRINDRGPFAGGRIIDLSRQAAEDLKMINKGVANVKLEYTLP